MSFLGRDASEFPLATMTAASSRILPFLEATRARTVRKSQLRLTGAITRVRFPFAFFEASASAIFRRLPKRIMVKL